MKIEKLTQKIVNIIKVRLKMAYNVEKEKNIIRMKILNMKVILLMINMKEMENIFGKMANIIQVNGKMG